MTNAELNRLCAEVMGYCTCHVGEDGETTIAFSTNGLCDKCDKPVELMIEDINKAYTKTAFGNSVYNVMLSVKNDVATSELITSICPADSMDSAIAWCERMGLEWHVFSKTESDSLYLARVVKSRDEYGVNENDVSISRNETPAAALVTAGLRALGVELREVE